MGKRKRAALEKAKLITVEEIEESCFCYYCEKECAHLHSLQDHMKTMHFSCLNCRKKLDTLNGLKVHVESVHKEKLEKIQNVTKPGREVVEGGLEIYLMEGVPEQLKKQFYEPKWEAYRKQQFELRVKESANSQPKKPKVEMAQETAEEKKARREAFVAQKRAEREAKKAAEMEGVVATTPDSSSGDSVAQEPYAKSADDDQRGKPEATAAVYGSQASNGYGPGYAASPPMAGYPMTQPPQPTFGYAMGPQYGYSPPTFGQHSPFPPPYPNPTFPQQPIGFGGVPQGFPHQSPVNPSPITRQPSTYGEPVLVSDAHKLARKSNYAEPLVAIAARKTSDPSMKQNNFRQRSTNHTPATQQTYGEPVSESSSSGITASAPSGLPARPSFNTPNYSIHDMSKMHATRKNNDNKKKPTANEDNTREATWKTADNVIRGLNEFYEWTQQKPEADNVVADTASEAIATQDAGAEVTGKQIADKQVTDEQATDKHATTTDAEKVKKEAAEPQPTDKQAATTEPKKAKMDAAGKNFYTQQKLSDNFISPEEKKGEQAKYAELTPKKRRTHRKDMTTVEQVHSQAVTGSVAMELEQ